MGAGEQDCAGHAVAASVPDRHILARYPLQRAGFPPTTEGMSLAARAAIA
jgi:hypothetical protein